jgi:hypothetical protein
MVLIQVASDLAEWQVHSFSESSRMSRYYDSSRVMTAALWLVHEHKEVKK